jgi:hypothetical protein
MAWARAPSESDVGKIVHTAVRGSWQDYACRSALAWFRNKVHPSVATLRAKTTQSEPRCAKNLESQDSALSDAPGIRNAKILIMIVLIMKEEKL